MAYNPLNPPETYGEAAGIPSTNVTQPVGAVSYVNQPPTTSTSTSASSFNPNFTSSSGYSSPAGSTYTQPSVITTPEAKTRIQQDVKDVTTMTENKQSGLSRSQVEGILQQLGRPTNDFTGITKNPDGTYTIPAGKFWDSETKDKTSKLDELINNLDETNKIPAEDPATVAWQNYLDQQIAQENAKADQWKLGLDTAYKQQIDSIKDSYSRRIEAMKLTNQSILGGTALRGARTGRQRYASEMQTDILSKEELAGASRIDELNSMMQAELNTAQQAYVSNDIALYSATAANLRNLQEQKRQAVLDQQKLASEQEARVMDKQKFELEVAKYYSDIDFQNATLEQKQQELNAPEKPMVVAPGSSIYDPTTGEFLGTAPERPKEGQIVKGENGEIFRYDPNSDQLSLIYKSGGDVSDSALDWATAISNGTAKLNEVPSDERTQVITAMNKLPPRQEDVSKIQNKIQTLDNIFNGVGYQLTKAVGTNWLSRIKFNPLSFDDKAQKNKLIATIDQLVGERALQALIDAKANGATFGALSEGELQLLKNSSTKFGNWARDVNNDGKTDYYEIDEKTFKEEIKKIKTEYNDLLNKTGGISTKNSTQSLDDYYLKNPDKRSYIDSLDSKINPNTKKYYTDEEKLQILGVSFKQVGGDTNLASKVSYIKDGTKGGQCGRFVNQLTGLGLGDSYQSKMAKMDKSIKSPAPGMVFVMPYKNTGHTGIILNVKNGIATVKDSNYSLDQKIKTHTIPVYKMTGFTYA